MKRTNDSIGWFALKAGQKGVSMIEVLVTMIVIALGLLGHGRLLATTLNHNNSAYMRSVATMLAYDIAECMRANRAAAIGGSYNVAIGNSPSGGTVAGDDLVSWKTRLAELLPAGDGSVTVDIQGNTTIVIQWDQKEDRDGDGNNDLIFLTTQTDL